MYTHGKIETDNIYWLVFQSFILLFHSYYIYTLLGIHEGEPNWINPSNSKNNSINLLNLLRMMEKKSKDKKLKI